MSNWRTYGAVNNWLPSYIRGRSNKSVANKLENCIDTVYRLKKDPGFGNSTFLSYVPTPYQLIENQLDKLTYYGGKLSGSMLCFNLEYLAVLRNVNKYSGHNLDLYLYTDDSVVKNAINKSMPDVTVLYDPAQSKDNLFDFMYRTLKQVDYNLDGSKRKHEYQVLKNEMKFDYVIGNPPYEASQNNTGKKGGGKDLWTLFVDKGIKMSNNYFSFVHPSLWRKPQSSRSWARDIQPVLFDHVNYVSINDQTSGQNMFGAGTRYDWYVGNVNEKTKSMTIVDENNEKVIIDMSNVSWIPNTKWAIEKTKDVLSTENDNRCNIIYSRSLYGTDNRYDHTSNNQTLDEYKYPLIHAINKDKNRYYYSNEKNEEHFGVSKVIIGDSMPIHDVIIDMNGEYGMTQHAMAIEVGNEKEATQIKRALMSDDFERFLNGCSWSNFQIDWRMFRDIKQDFWKEFV